MNTIAFFVIASLVWLAFFLSWYVSRVRSYRRIIARQAIAATHRNGPCPIAFIDTPIWGRVSFNHFWKTPTSATVTFMTIPTQTVPRAKFSSLPLKEKNAKRLARSGTWYSVEMGRESGLPTCKGLSVTPERALVKRLALVSIHTVDLNAALDDREYDAHQYA